MKTPVEINAGNILLDADGKLISRMHDATKRELETVAGAINGFVELRETLDSVLELIDQYDSGELYLKAGSDSIVGLARAILKKHEGVL